MEVWEERKQQMGVQKRKDRVSEVQPTKPDNEQGLEAEEDSNAERKTLTGLSLCQCRKEMLWGQIWIESKEGFCRRGRGRLLHVDGAEDRKGAGIKALPLSELLMILFHGFVEEEEEEVWGEALGIVLLLVVFRLILSNHIAGLREYLHAFPVHKSTMNQYVN